MVGDWSADEASAADYNFGRFGQNCIASKRRLAPQTQIVERARIEAGNDMAAATSIEQ